METTTYLNPKKTKISISSQSHISYKRPHHSIGDTFHSVIGLDENWASGKYLINLKYQGEILDSKSFTILRDNEVESAIIIYENMLKIVEDWN